MDYKSNENQMLKQDTRPVRDLSQITGEITKKLIEDFEPQEQRDILFRVKENIISHYQELRENHLKGAELFANKIEMLQ